MSSYIDLILIIYLGYSIYQGYKNGFVNSLSQLLFIVCGILLSLFLGIKLKGIIYPGLVASPYLAIGIITLIFIGIFRKLIQKITILLTGILKKFDLLWLDPILGGALSFIKTCLIIFVVISFLGSFNNKAIMEPIFNSTVARQIYHQAGELVGINLMKFFHDLSIKKTAEKTTEIVDKTIDIIEK